MGKALIISMVVLFILYMTCVWVIGSQVSDGLQNGSIAHGLGSFWYQVQQGAKGK